jgi:hypothetical protein
MQRLHTGCDNDFAAVEPPESTTVPGSKRKTSTGFESDSHAPRVDDPNRRISVRGRQGARRERDSVAMVDFHPARYGCTKSHGRWWIMDRDADVKGARDRISLRVDLPHSALCGDTGSSVRATITSASPGAVRST